jgi:hypothetical protein
MGSLPSSGEHRVHQAKRRLVLDLFLRRGAVWDRIRDIRERWGIKAQRQMPPPYPHLYTPESFGPQPEEQFGEEEYDRWHAKYQEWVNDLATVYGAVVPEKARDSKHYVGSSWSIFLPMCVLFDPPETKLDDFAKRVGGISSNVIPRGPKYSWMPAPPIVWLTDGDRAKKTMTEFYEGLLSALLEKYVHPQGITTEDAVGSIRKERPELFERLMQGIYDNESRPYIDVKPYHRQQDIESAFKVLSTRHETRPTTGRPKRDELTAVQCAILYDRHNLREPADKRRRTWTYERLAREHDLESRRAAKEYVELGRELLKQS